MTSPKITIDYLSSPFNAVLNSVDPVYEKTFKDAIYHTAALVFVLLCGGIAVALYFVLETFLRPLLWAILCGAFLYPFKKTASCLMRKWLASLQENRTPFVVGVAVSPFKCTNHGIDQFAEALTSNKKLTVTVLCSFPLIYLIYFVLQSNLHLGDSIQVGFYLLDAVLNVFQRPVWVWTIVVSYIIVVVFFYDPVYKDVLSKCSVVLYVVLLFHLVSLTGNWRLPLALCAIIVIGCGAFTQQQTDSDTPRINTNHFYDKVKDKINQYLIKLKETKSYAPSWLNILIATNQDLSPEASGNEITSKSSSDSLNLITNVRKKLVKQRTMRKKSSSASPSTAEGRTSDVFFIGLFWIICLTALWLNLWILQFVPFMLLIYFIKRFFATRMFEMIYDRLIDAMKPLDAWITERHDAFLPSPVKGTTQVLIKIDQKVMSYIEQSTDKIMSAFIILCLLVVVVFSTGFLAFQAHHESTHLAYVTRNILNETIYSHPHVFGFLTENKELQKTLDPMIHKAYIFGREWVAGKIHGMLSSNQQNETEVEKQVLHLIDQLYASWMNWHQNKSSSANRHGMKDGNASKTLKRQSTILSFPSMTNFTQLLFGSHGYETSSTILTLIKDNIDTLKSFVQSIYGLLKGNIQIAFHVMTSAISVVFFSGTYLLNFGLSVVVFMTALFYLLSISNEQYKPVEWFSAVSMGTRLGESINKAVRGVFGAALKMAVFYGCYTWTTHTLIGTNFTFIPSAIAACLAVVPFIGTYWAVLPSALELWLVQDQEVLAILLIILQLLPTYFVDVAIYSEIGGGGHPYMTGLAVAGGIYCFGLEGALIGPIVLSCLIAAYDSFAEIVNDTSPMPSASAKPSFANRESSVHVVSPTSSPRAQRKLLRGFDSSSL